MLQMLFYFSAMFLLLLVLIGWRLDGCCMSIAVAVELAMTQSVEGAIRLNLCHIKAPSLRVRRYFVVKFCGQRKNEKKNEKKNQVAFNGIVGFASIISELEKCSREQLKYDPMKMHAFFL